MFKKLTLIVLSCASLFAMHSVEININDKDLEVGTNLDLGQFNDSIEPDTTFISLKYLKASNEYSSHKSDDNKEYVDLGFFIKQEIADSGFKFGIGVKANYAKVKISNGDDYFITVPLGLEVGYELPFDNVIPIILGVKLYYAPESLVFADAESYFEHRADVNFKIINRGALVIGYRNINTNYKIDSRKIDVRYNESTYFGFKFAF